MITTTTTASITINGQRQPADVLFQSGRWFVVRVCGHVVATDGTKFVQVTRKGRTQPVYNVLEGCELHPVRDVNGWNFVSIPK